MVPHAIIATALFWAVTYPIRNPKEDDEDEEEES
jgi:hypothetical protein